MKSGKNDVKDDDDKKKNTPPNPDLKRSMVD